jgi:hypothetical protein
MGGSILFWVNVDKPTKKCTIHNEDCTYVVGKKETDFKGIEILKRDGGWFSFSSNSDAENYCRSKFNNYSIVKHCIAKYDQEPPKIGNNEGNDSPDSTAMFWVNVDKPTKKCTIHKKNCTYVVKQRETTLKGIGKLKKDGGWFDFKTNNEAENYCRSNFSNYNISHCIAERFLEPTKIGSNEENDKLDTSIVDDRLKSIEEAIKEIKNQNEKSKADTETKLISIYEKIDRGIEELKEKIDIEQYLIKVNLEYWDRLDSKTQQFLFMAEYLYEYLLERSKLTEDQKEYSPVILEYCKCIENELRTKIFLDFREFYKKYKYPRNFGDMIGDLQQLSNEHLNNQDSPYKEIKNFLKKCFNMDRLLWKKFLDKLYEINNNYRNKSAHPHLMTIKDTQECRDKVISTLDYFMSLIIGS